VLVGVEVQELPVVKSVVVVPMWDMGEIMVKVHLVDVVEEWLKRVKLTVGVYQ
jgi:hypothetical protein